MWVYVGVCVVWFSVVNHIRVYVGVCGCMRGVVQSGEPVYVGVCGCMCGVVHNEPTIGSTTNTMVQAVCMVQCGRDEII